jgi:nitrite reductase/ring-hydroxylating ferredoxin subunit
VTTEGARQAVSQANPVEPDFGAGVDAATVPEGHMVSGSLHGKRVLLAKVQGQYYAVSATCTHLGAPLEQGLCVDGAVRCPWHHARFSLSTGEALASPAFDPLSRFLTSVQDGRVLISEAPQP